MASKATTVAPRLVNLILDDLGKALAIRLTIVHDRQVLDVQLVVKIGSREFTLSGIREDVAVEDLGTGRSQVGVGAEGEHHRDARRLS